MSCCGKTKYNANGDQSDWRVFRNRAVNLAQCKNDAAFIKYVEDISDKAWAHILEENFFTPERAMERLWGFYQTDVLAYQK